MSAARDLFKELPHYPFARLLVAILLVARGELTDAEREVDAAIPWVPIEAQIPRFPAVALHWLKGLLCLARSADEEALTSFALELAQEPRGHIYGRECCANTSYAIGACHLRRGEHAAARAGFDQAIARVSRHPMAHVGLRLLTGDRSVDASSDAPITVDLAVARAAMLVADGDTSAAVRVVAAALDAAPPGNAGWIVPIEPLLGVQRDRSAWMPVLVRLSDRAC